MWKWIKTNKTAGMTLPDGSILSASIDDPDLASWLALGNTPEAADPEPPLDDNAAAQIGVKAWFVAHPSAALLFNLSIVDLDLEIDDLVDDLFPTASAANKNRLKLWMKTVSHSVRALAKREGFT